MLCVCVPSGDEGSLRLMHACSMSRAGTVLAAYGPAASILLSFSCCCCHISFCQAFLLSVPSSASAAPLQHVLPVSSLPPAHTAASAQATRKRLAALQLQAQGAGGQAVRYVSSLGAQEGDSMRTQHVKRVSAMRRKEDMLKGLG